MRDKINISLLVILVLAGLFTLSSFFGIKLKKSEVTAAGTDYYVSPAGNDKNNGKEKSLPFKRIQTALKEARPGDTVNLLSGEYYESFKTVRNGRSSQPITITGAKEAIVKGGDADRVVEINHSYIRLSGFTIDGKRKEGKKQDDFADKLIYVLGKKPKKALKGLKISNMEIKNAGGECVRFRYYVQGAEFSNNTVRDCGIHDFVFKDGGKNGEGLYIGTAPEQRKDGKNPSKGIDKSNKNWIHDNYFETNGNECVDIKEGSSGNLVERNRCTGQKDPESGGLDSRGNSNIFRDNEVYDNLGAGVRLGGDSFKDGTKNTVRNNILRNNRAGAIKIERKPQKEICGNTFDSNGEKIFFGKYASTQKVISCQ